MPNGFAGGGGGREGEDEKLGCIHECMRERGRGAPLENGANISRPSLK